MDTTGTKDFVLYSEVSFAQGPCLSYNRGRLCWSKTVDHEICSTDKRSIDSYPLDKNQGHIWGLYCNCRSLILIDVNGGCGLSVRYVRSFAIVLAQMGLKLVSVIWNSRVSTVLRGF